MLLEVEKAGETMIVRLKGELDLCTAERFKKVVEEELETRGIKNIILNLAQVPFIDSSGLGVILGRYKRVQEKGGKLAAVELIPAVKRIFELSGLPRIINIYDQESQAVADI